MKKQVVIVGAGFAGLRMFYRLQQQKNIEITLVEPRDGSLDRPVLPEVAFAGKSLHHALVPVRPIVERHGANYIQRSVEGIDAAKNALLFENGERLSYDYLMLAVGAHKDYDAIPGFREYGFSVCDDTEAPRLATAVRAFRGGPVIVGAAKSVWGNRVVVPNLAAPCEGPIGEIVFMLDRELRRRGLREASTITAFSPGAMFFDDVGPKVHAAIEPMLKTRGIEVVVAKELAAIERDRVRFVDGSSIESAFTIVIPPYVGNRAIAASGLGDERGFIPTDETMRHLDHENIFAAGDGTALSMPKLGHIAIAQADIAAAALVRALTGNGVVPPYRPEVFCIMNQGGADATLILSDTLFGGTRDITMSGPLAHAMKWAFDSYYFYTRGHMPPDRANGVLEFFIEHGLGR